MDDLGHTETAVHLRAIWQLYSSSRYDASLVVGPSFFHVKQDFVEAVAATESGSPYTAVTLNATFGSASKTAIGANAGVEFNYRLSGDIGAGVFVRWAAASVKMAGAGGESHTVKLGGPQIGLALRYRF